MIWLLRSAFLVILICMLAVTAWASRIQALWAIPSEVLSNPWFIATLFDAYFGFLTFYAWVAYRERRWTTRIVWLIAILVLGNIAMASYALLQLFSVPSGTPLSSLLRRKDELQYT